jgi:hypothetical protein
LLSSIESEQMSRDPHHLPSDINSGEVSISYPP